MSKTIQSKSYISQIKIILHPTIVTITWSNDKFTGPIEEILTTYMPDGVPSKNQLVTKGVAHQSYMLIDLFLPFNVG